ncbi:MAG TPA: hypothetical protein VGJ26_19455 [Pirellulales bacterium]
MASLLWLFLVVALASYAVCERRARLHADAELAAQAEELKSLRTLYNEYRFSRNFYPSAGDK